jgi:carboxymethylenebutenolidase
MTTTKQPGFAPAATPHASTAVHTSEESIIAGETSIPSQGENMPAYHARPKMPTAAAGRYRGSGNFRRA